MIRFATLLLTLLALATLASVQTGHAIEPCAHEMGAGHGTIHAGIGHVAATEQSNTSETSVPTSGRHAHATASQAPTATPADHDRGHRGCGDGCLDMGLCRHLACAAGLILPTAPALPKRAAVAVRFDSADAHRQGRAVAPALDPPRSV